MTRTGLSLATAALFSVLLVACSPEPQPGEGDAETMTSESAVSEEAGAQDPSLAACTATAVCGSCTTLTCSGTSTCSALNGPLGHATCDGVRNACRTCTYQRESYADGSIPADSADTYCSAKVDGYCIGGPWAGRPCVATGQCLVRCCNGTWRR
jgi:hypothetical protein